MNVKVQRIADVEMVSYAKEGDAAFDLRSSHDVIIPPGHKEIIKTGLKMAIPKDYVGLIWDRSGLAAKHSAHVLAGVIDSGYRGEIGVVLKNLGHEPLEITKNMRVAQMLIQPVVSCVLEEVDELDETERGDTGFGSSGTH